MNIRAVACAARPRAMLRLQAQTRRSATRREPVNAGGGEAFARSARTQASVGGACSGPRKAAGVAIVGISRWHVLKGRSGPVEHKASPTRCGRTQQAVIPNLLQSRSAAPQRQIVRGRITVCLARSSPLVLTFRLRGHVILRAFSFVRRSDLNADRENSTQNIRSHIAMSGNPIKALKAPLTCKPPLICMPALVSQSH